MISYDRVLLDIQVKPLLYSHPKKNLLIKWMKDRIRGIFAVCGYREGYMEQKKIDYLDKHMAKICGVSNVPTALFPGRFTAVLMEPEIREQMGQRGPMEDTDDLKRSDCMAFGKEVLASIQAG